MTPSDDNSGLAPELPEKRKSYASTTSSRASSVFSDTTDATCPLSPLSPSGHFNDKMGNVLSSPYPVGARRSSASSTSTLSATTLRPGVEGFMSPGSNTSGQNGYSYVTPPTSPRVPNDCVSSSHEVVSSWVSENTTYFSAASSSFNAGGLSEGTQPVPSTPRNIDLDLLGQPSPMMDATPPDVPSKFTQTFSSSVESWSTSEMMSVVTSSTTTLESRDEAGQKPRTPVPLPRRGIVSASNKPAGVISRSVSDASDLVFTGRDKTPPPVMPRKTLHFGADQGPTSPPPKPPRPSQTPAARQPPVYPKPYVSKSVDNSPTMQRKVLEPERKET